MVDGGSSVDVCPLSTLPSMKINTDRIRHSNVHIRAFDGSARDTMGEINLTMTIGPVDFEIVFQVVDMVTSYNFLLGRPWIHTARAVPSTLHQMLKFEHDGQEIIVHGEDESSVYKDPLIPCIEAKEGSESIRLLKWLLWTMSRKESPFCILVFPPHLVVIQISQDDFLLMPALITCMQNSCPDLEKQSNIEITHQEVEYEEDEIVEEIKRELEQFENKPKPNLNETETINIGSPEEHEIQSFVDCYAGYHQILMDEDDAEKTAFTTPWGTYCYRVMPFGLKNAGATYMRAMTTIFHDMMHKEIELYIDDVIIKSKTQADHVCDLKKFFERLRRYDLKLNPAKCAFGVPAGKLLGFIVSRRGIELDPSKIKSI
ncbi:uncharacterized protein [Nicotiana sylvestris]|uniref:uncharacterized protein n=1 Tax=Nicotiana sylvestris TaxID=4096 RepID=UPI00388CCBA2